jgi:hypothetical protein
MTKRRSDTDTGSLAGGSLAGDAAAKPSGVREQRLSAALRANLARRKVQARARTGPSMEAGLGDKPAAGDQAGKETHDSAGFVPDKQGS